jgi:hypothetical protein
VTLSIELPNDSMPVHVRVYALEVVVFGVLNVIEPVSRYSTGDFRVYFFLYFSDHHYPTCLSITVMLNYRQNTNQIITVAAKEYISVRCCKILNLILISRKI